MQNKSEVALFDVKSSKSHRKKCKQKQNCHLCQQTKTVHLWEHINNCPIGISIVKEYTKDLKMNKVGFGGKSCVDELLERFM